MTRAACLALIAILLLLSLVACGPEGDRQRGGGPGADVGNRDSQVQLHGDEPGSEQMYWDTPLDPAVK